MSVAAALTMDEQRLNSYNKTNPLSGPASPQSPQQYHQQQQQHQHQQQEQQPTFDAEQRLLEEIDSLKDEQARLLQQYADSQRREKILTRRLANKEQEFQDYVSQIAEYKAAQAPSALALRSALLDPAVNLLFEKLKKELKATKAKLEETQNELSAWKFTPDSNTGKRLMAKCRLLYQENEELGKMTSSGRLAKLETELAMQKSFSEEVKKSQSELDDFLQELDEDVEGMQSTILFLQQELKTTRERIQLLEKENYQLKNGGILDAEDIQKDNSEQINAQQHHGGLNGNNMMTSIVGGVCNSTDNNININQDAINSDSYQKNEMKFQTANTVVVGSNNNKLTPIEEEPCVRVLAYTCGGVGGGNDDGYYNGNNNNMAVENDDGGNLAAGSRALRATSARKRAYDNLDVNEATNTNLGSGNGGDGAGTPPTPTTTPTPIATSHIPMQQHTITQVVAPPVPRTLPPKKSKLRMTPPTIQQPDSLIELSREHDSNLAINTLSADNIVAMTTTAAAAAAVTVEETINDEHAGGTGAGVPQRIMTRRRSMRTAQQNGA